MKTRLLILAAALAASIAAPVTAQLANKGNDFVNAVRKDDGNKARELLEEMPLGLIDARDYNGETALGVALSKRDTDWTGYLLNAGADPNLLTMGGNPPLVIAARVGFTDAVTWLLAKGARVDETNKMGETALIAAVQGRHRDVVRLLLNAGANPDKTDNAQGYSARDYATRDTRAREIRKLIEAR